MGGIQISTTREFKTDGLEVTALVCYVKENGNPALAKGDLRRDPQFTGPFWSPSLNKLVVVF